MLSAVICIEREIDFGRMKQFVNYKKRGFTLPSGCKDLLDVLAPPQRQGKAQVAAGRWQRPEIEEERFPTAGLAQIGRYVSMLLRSRGEFFTLVTAQDFEFPVTLYRSRSEQTDAMVLATKEAHREQTIRSFFEQQGIEALSEFDTADAARGLVYPLPSDVAGAIRLTTELLRSVYGLTDEAGIDFRYYEMESLPVP